MKVLQVLVLFVLSLVFCFEVKAQICGPSKTKIYVRDNKENTIPNVKFEFLGLNKGYFKDGWLTFKDDAYFIYFAQSDIKPYGNHSLKISAEGFETSVQTIKISEAQYQIFNLKLKREGTDEQGYFEELLWFGGKITDRNEAGISNTRIILSNRNGERIETLSDKKGGYYIEVSQGNYDIEILGTAGFASAKYENLEISGRQNHLDAILEVDSNCNCLITELVCKPHKFLANTFDCILVTKNPSKKN